MVIKGEASEIEINVTNGNSGYRNDGWIIADIKIAVPGLKAWYGADIQIAELHQFYQDLIKLDNLTEKYAEFNTLEEWLHLECDLQKNGHVLCSGRVVTENGDSLNFTVQTDIASISKFVSQLKTTLSKFPVSINDKV